MEHGKQKEDKLNQQEQIVNNNKEEPKVDPSFEAIINEIDKDIFFAVSVAKKKTNAVLKKKIEVSMLPIYDRINAAINNGQFFTECVLTDDQRNFLSKRNFWTTATRTDNGRTTYKIRWD